jgi:AraC-like DNA-binding protein
MSVELLSEPLSRFRVVDTSEPDELGQALATVYGVRRFQAPADGAFRVRGNFVQLQDIALGFSAGIGAIAIEFPEADYARLQISLSGQSTTRSAGAATVTNAQQACVTSPGRPARIEFGANYENLLLRVRTIALERKLTVLLGSKPKASIEFESAASNETPQSVMLRQMIAFVSGLLNSPTPPPPLVLAELQEAITLMFLSTYRHNFTRLLERETRGVAPRHVRQVEEYIEANWARPLTIEKLTALTGISARGIFKAFQRSRGYSPMAFAKRVRLQHARDLLRDGDNPTTVTAAALACGFANLGHFARDYRVTFGEKPSETLQQARH